MKQKNNSEAFHFNQQGFTLIELLIVVAIIGILASIAVPQFSAFRIRSYNASAKALIKQAINCQADLNAELGAYGHIEDDAYNLAEGLKTAQGSGMEISSRDVSQFAIPATAGKVGGRISGMNAIGGKVFSVPMGIGNDMTIFINENVNSGSCTTGGCAYVLIAQSDNGDTAYGYDSDLDNRLYSVSNPNWKTITGLGFNPNLLVVDGSDNFKNVDANGKPTAYWRLLY